MNALYLALGWRAVPRVVDLEVSSEGTALRSLGFSALSISSRDLTVDLPVGSPPSVRPE